MVVKYNIKTDNKVIKCVEFDSIIDQYEYIMPSIRNNRFGNVTELEKDMGWNGSYTLNEVVEGMKYGLQKSTDYFLDNIKEIRSQDTTGRGTFLDYDGFAYDMGSVVEGVLECCLNADLPAVKPCIKVLVDVSFSCWHSANQLDNRGIAIANLINTLIINGYIVDLCFMLYNTQSDMDIMATTRVNTEVLPISTVAFLSGSDYFRKIGFITMDEVRDKASNWGRGQSYIQNFMLNKFKKEDIFFIGGSYANPQISSHINTVSEANEYIISLFATYCKEHKIKLTFKDKEEYNV